jgi:hypothetical protein
MAENDVDSTAVVTHGLSAWGSASDELGGDQGFGFIGLANIGFGYKCYISGMKNNETFFRFEFKDEAGRKVAQDAANAFYAKHNVLNKDGDPQLAYPAFAIRLYKDRVVSKDVSAWVEDRWWVYPLWSKVNLWKIIVQPALDKLKLNVGTQDVWCQLRYKVDPSGKTYQGTDKDGNPATLPSLVFYISEVYKNEEDARSHVRSKSEDAGKAEPSFPKGYTAEGWKVQAAEIKEAFEQTQANTDAKEFSVNDVIANLATVYDLRESWIKVAVGS